MKPGRHSLILLAGALALQPVLAEAFTSRSNARVNPVNASIFEVVPTAGGSGAVYWCAAADYAQRELRAPWQASLFVARGLGAGATANKRSTVQFTLDPQGAGITPGRRAANVNSLEVGESMSVQQGFYFCQKGTRF